MFKFENQKNKRFYYIEVKKDLFKDVVINTIRGGSNVTLERTVFCGNGLELRRKLRQIFRKRLSRGYTLIE